MLKVLDNIGVCSCNIFFFVRVYGYIEELNLTFFKSLLGYSVYVGFTFW